MVRPSEDKYVLRRLIEFGVLGADDLRLDNACRGRLGDEEDGGGAAENTDPVSSNTQLDVVKSLDDEAVRPRFNKRNLLIIDEPLLYPKIGL